MKPVRVLSAAVLIFLFCFGFGVASHLNEKLELKQPNCIR